MASLLRNHFDRSDGGIFLNSDMEELGYEFPTHDCYGKYSEYFLDHFGLKKNNDPLINRERAIMTLYAVSTGYVFNTNSLPKIIPMLAVALKDETKYDPDEFNALVLETDTPEITDPFFFDYYPKVGRYTEDISHLIVGFKKKYPNSSYDKGTIPLYFGSTYKPIIYSLGYFVNAVADRSYNVDIPNINYYRVTDTDTAISKIMEYEGIRRVIAIKRYTVTQEIKDKIPIDISGIILPNLR